MLSLRRALLSVRFFCLLVLIVISPFVDAKKPITINYPTLADGNKFQTRDSYFIALFDLVTKKASRQITLKKVELPEIREDRALLLLKERRIDVFWMTTNEERERELLPIRIPLYRGVIGWRIMMIHEDNKDIFTRLRSVNDIRSLRAAQGHDWPDSDILEVNGYKLIRVSTWSAHFGLVQHKRIDYFPRSIIEIHYELADRKDMGLAIEPSVVFRYPAALYFFVSKENTEAASAIEEALNKSIEDGSFNRLFMAFYGDSIRKSMLDRRKTVYLRNPTLPSKTPLERKELWFNTDELRGP